MNFSVQVKVMPLKELLDPQGKAVMGGLQNLGIKTIRDVRIGKTILPFIGRLPENNPTPNYSAVTLVMPGPPPGAPQVRMNVIDILG